VPNDTLRLTLSGAPATLAARAFDAQGEELIGAPFEFSAEAARIASIGTPGIVTPVAIGTTTVAVAIDGLREVRTIVVGTVPSASAPVITAISTTTILPGVPFTIRGERFAATSALNSALVDGLPLSVTAASATQLTALLPASGVPCLPTRTVAVQVTTPGGTGAGVARLEVAPQRTLAVGEALILTSGSAAACNEFADGAGRYLVAVQHGGRALGAGSIALALEGRTGSGPVVAMQAPNVLGSVHDARGSHRLDRHAQLLAASAEAARAARVANAVPSAPPLASLQVPPVNGIVQVRVPDLTSSNLCTSFTTIGARTVYEGARVAILEDTVSRRDGVPTLAGTMDELYSQIGQEVDAVLWPLARRFGDPLVMDSRLDANDRVVLVATPRLNAMLNGEILGAVVTCDFFARAQFASSNVGEVMYLQVPTSTAPGIGPGTRERWRHEIRGTIAHELKHLVSYAGRIVRNQPLEEVWLEEATARHAEELFARARLGFTPTADMGYAALDCEVRALQGAGLYHWAVGGVDLEALADRAARAGLSGGALVPGGRLKPDGSRLDWLCWGLHGHDFGALVPFFIDWRGSQHPAEATPRGGRLAAHRGQQHEVGRVFDELLLPLGLQGFVLDADGAALHSLRHFRIGVLAAV
jgi:hypothetical protein